MALGRIIFLSVLTVALCLSFSVLSQNVSAVHGNAVDVHTEDGKSVHANTVNHATLQHYVPPSIILQYIKLHHLK